MKSSATPTTLVLNTISAGAFFWGNLICPSPVIVEPVEDACNFLICNVFRSLSSIVAKKRSTTTRSKLTVFGVVIFSVSAGFAVVPVSLPFS